MLAHFAVPIPKHVQTFEMRIFFPDDIDDDDDENGHHHVNSHRISNFSGHFNL